MHLLIGHATRSTRWDIPKGLAEAGEDHAAAAHRECLEETGLKAPPDMERLGRFHYLPGKELVLFLWHVPVMPDPASLRCGSTFMLNGRLAPEFDQFACPVWSVAVPKLGKAMAASPGGNCRDETMGLNKRRGQCTCWVAGRDAGIIGRNEASSSAVSTARSRLPALNGVFRNVSCGCSGCSRGVRLAPV